MISGYMDVFVCPIPKQKTADYKAIAELSSKLWTEHGAISYIELEADDVEPGELTSFPQSVGLKEDEFVVVALITYQSRAHRDEVNAKVMKDPRMAEMRPKIVPFDSKRMFWGGFKPFVGQLPMPRIQPYLFFRGRCEEAIEYYKSVLGAEVVMMMRFSDNPDKPGCDLMPAEFGNRIMHASLRIAGTVIMMSDGMKSGPLDFGCMSLSLAVSSEAECDRIYNALAADGKVEMPIGPTFFAKRYGGVIDKFGVSWMIIVPQIA